MTSPDEIRRREGFHHLLEDIGPRVWTATVRPPTDRLLGWHINVSKNGMELLGAKFALGRRRAERKAQRWVNKLERADQRRSGESFTVEAQR